MLDAEFDKNTSYKHENWKHYLANLADFKDYFDYKSDQKSSTTDFWLEMFYCDSCMNSYDRRAILGMVLENSYSGSIRTLKRIESLA